MTRDYALLREEVSGLSLSRCYRCDTYASLEYGHCHHRKLRSRGGRDDLWNVVWLCEPCHSWAHSRVRIATQEGFLCPSTEDPRRWPIKNWSGWWQPSPAGLMFCPGREEG